MALKTYGLNGVDWEERVNWDRLRKGRLDRAKAELAKSEMGAILCFDMNNVRYLSPPASGAGRRTKISRFVLLTCATTSRFCGISDPPQNITSSTAPGWATARARESG